MDGIERIEFIIDGEPRGKGRPRFTKAGRTYTDSKTAAYERTVRQSAWVAMAKNKLPPTSANVFVEITAYHGIPKSWPNKKRALAVANVIKPKKPDIDNIIKAVLDGCNGVVFLDDAQVHAVNARKQYCGLDVHPLVHVRISWTK